MVATMYMVPSVLIIHAYSLFSSSVGHELVDPETSRPVSLKTEVEKVSCEQQFER